MAKAEHELLSYGRAMIVGASGTVMCVGFLGSVIAVIFEYKPSSLWFWTNLLQQWTIASAGEVAAWRLKWIALPVAAAVLWSGARLIRSIKKEPTRFAGLRAARVGFVAAVLATIMIAGLIGITIPERLRQRQLAIEAAIYARGYTLHRALLEYRDLHGFIPAQDDVIAELKTLPDPNGSIAEALRGFDVNGYKPNAVLAATTRTKPQALRGSALRGAATRAEQPLSQGVSFTNYELRLPSEHKLFGTDDDFIMRDGLISKVSEPSSASSHPNTP
ncbi:MAG TPA: hypothetical protein VHD88_08825 [Pyrinomonadaceae bacterium]|nr:hypothetical protein [Pyrinomonadaceae bacterium]